MPLLEFRCRQCGNHFEDLVRTADEARCPRCGSAKQDRLISAFAVRAGGSAPASPCAEGPCGSCPDTGGCGFPG